MLKGSARAHTNIALIKYWGKANEDLIIPMNNSLSLTLDAFYTETTVTFSEELTTDIFYLDDTLQDEKGTKKISRFLDLVRKKAACPLFAEVNSYNHVPTAAGLASSSSGLAALAAACNQALQLDLSDRDLSRLARRGSGSACRSIFPGFVEWQKGNNDETSFAEVVPSSGWENELAMLFILINDQEKDISSRDGMRKTVETSAFYDGWLQTTTQDLASAKIAIHAQDFEKLGTVTENNALKMHGTTLAAVPPFTYWSPDSLKAMNAVRKIRAAGLPCYFTMDAGPNVKVLCQRKDVAQLKEKLTHYFADEQLITAFSGPGITYL